jgi:hypothetical protein
VVLREDSEFEQTVQTRRGAFVDAVVELVGPQRPVPERIEAVARLEMELAAAHRLLEAYRRQLHRASVPLIARRGSCCSRST